MDDLVKKLDEVVEHLYNALGAVAKNVTEEDFLQMEEMGMSPNRKLVKEAVNRHLGTPFAKGD